MTFPITVESTILGSMLPAANAAFAAISCKSADVLFVSFPLRVTK